MDQTYVEVDTIDGQDKREKINGDGDDFDVSPTWVCGVRCDT